MAYNKHTGHNYIYWLTYSVIPNHCILNKFEETKADFPRLALYSALLKSSSLPDTHF